MVDAVVGAPVPTVVVERPGTSTARGSTAKPGATIRTTRERFVFFCRAALEWLRRMPPPPDVVHVHDWQAALVPGLPGRGPRARAIPSCTRTARDHDHPQPRLSGPVLGGRLASPEPRSAVLHARGARVLRLHQLPEGRHRVRRRDHDGEPDATPRRSGRRRSAKASTACCARAPPTRRHPERRRLRRRGIRRPIPRSPAPLRRGATSRARRAARRRCRRSSGSTVRSDAPAARRDLAPAPSRRASISSPTSRPSCSRRATRSSSSSAAAIRALERALRRARATGTRGASRVRLGFDDPLAHRIEAGADLFLMPSRYEPCGLTQIYSLRYGTRAHRPRHRRARRHRRRTTTRATDDRHGLRVPAPSDAARSWRRSVARWRMRHDRRALDGAPAPRHGGRLLVGPLRREALRRALRRRDARGPCAWSDQPRTNPISSTADSTMSGRVRPRAGARDRAPRRRRRNRRRRSPRWRRRRRVADEHVALAVTSGEPQQMVHSRRVGLSRRQRVAADRARRNVVSHAEPIEDACASIDSGLLLSTVSATPRCVERRRAPRRCRDRGPWRRGDARRSTSRKRRTPSSIVGGATGRARARRAVARPRRPARTPSAARSRAGRSVRSTWFVAAARSARESISVPSRSNATCVVPERGRARLTGQGASGRERRAAAAGVLGVRVDELEPAPERLFT